MGVPKSRLFKAKLCRYHHIDGIHDRCTRNNNTIQAAPTSVSLTIAPTPGTQLNLSFVSTASKDRLRRVTTSRIRVAVSREVLLDLFLLAFF